ncbi:MAG: hypothetical protein LC808_07165, partial [Actinobacteria bacterium]|nr:hypothetical protein [Actinomycetota bacterium]
LRHQPTINDLTFKFVFPASWARGQATEQSNLGVIHVEQLPTGQTQVVWHHEAPGAGAYQWVLHGSAAD